MSGSAKPKTPIEVFISYSRRDETFRRELEDHLSLLARQNLITNWHDRKIGAGREFKGLIDRHLNSAHIILLLVSKDFIASDYCYDIEMKRALERHRVGEARVIPIILRPCDWKFAPLSDLQPLPQDGKPITKWRSHDDAFQNIVIGIRSALGELTSAPSIGTISGIVPRRSESAAAAATHPFPPIADPAHVATLLVNIDSPNPIFLLGAGASQKSGVPLKKALIERAVKEVYCRVQQRPPNDPTIRRSDWNSWLECQSWYEAGNTESLYITALSNLFQTTEERRNFFREAGRPAVQPSSGYRDLLKLMIARHVQTVLTTNFDSVLSTLAVSVPNPHHVTVIRSPDDYQYITTAPTQPQLIHLLGDSERYADTYFAEGYQRVDGKLVELLRPLFRDHPLVVIGYSGRELSIMQDLLLSNTEPTLSFRHGMYWCLPASQEIADLDRNVIALASSIGTNFHLVRIEGFDEFMTCLIQACERTPTNMLAPDSGPSVIPLPFDMQAVSNATLECLDWNEVEARMVAYCEKMSLTLPATRELLIEQMVLLDLARRDYGIIKPTVAGILLFAKSPTDYLPSARIEVQIAGSSPTQIRGNVWSQLRVIDMLESEFNVPFRLKGPASKTVTPYPSLAIKEIVVNALAHRRYDGRENEQVTISVDHSSIQVTNPGGLDQSVLNQLPKDVSPEEVLGNRPIKGYRNPVLADLLFSSGAMDKLGSGLIDVAQMARQNGGRVQFALGHDNGSFQVTLFRRPESPDSITAAAQPLTSSAEFSSNILEFVDLPERIWTDETIHRWVPEILNRNKQEPLPSFVLYDGRLYTFSNLELVNNRLRQFITGKDIHPMPVSDFTGAENGERRLVNLLNEALRHSCKLSGLIFDWKAKRAYFPRTEEGSRTVTYHARFRQATRTVVKARISSVTNKVVYWEHQAVSFQFKRFLNEWGLQLLPTYVFTEDGYFRQLARERLGPMATHRMSRDYNAQVDSHLVFWSTLLSDGQPEVVLEDAFDSRISLRSLPSSVVLESLLEPEENRPSLAEDEIDELNGQLTDLLDEGLDEEDNASEN